MVRSLLVLLLSTAPYKENGVGTWSGIRRSRQTQSVYAASTLSTFLGNALITNHEPISMFGLPTYNILAVKGSATIQDTESDNLASKYDFSLPVGDKATSQQVGLL